MKKQLLVLIIVVFSMPMLALSEELSESTIENYFEKVTGLDYRSSDYDELKKMADGKELDEDTLFEVLFQHPYFVNNRLATFVSRLSNEDGDPFQPEDDFQAALILAVTEGIDLRRIFTDKFSIQKNEDNTVVKPGANYYLLGQKAQTLSEVPQNHHLNFYGEENGEEQTFGNGYYHGLFTTYGFGERFFKGGTNRRPIRAIYDIFLCSDTSVYKDPSLDPFYVGRDIDRDPGDDPHNFEEDCSSCHAVFDSERPSYAYVDFDEQSNELVLLQEVAAKLNRNPKTIMGQTVGHLVVSDYFESLLTSPRHQDWFEWRGDPVGSGYLDYAKRISNSGRFQKCMTQRLVKEFCSKPEDFLANSNLDQEMLRLSEELRAKNYVVKDIVKEIVRSPLCNN